ncbi:MAG: molybdenum cofactor guanylyltransferase MobA [Nevskia sp.]|nr:molybdenum cofactor guanylyltransferase MobA [Nevskia sp.]
MNARPTALILCGGGATRLGGIDKPLRDFGGAPLIERVLQRIAPQVGSVIISANRSHQQYKDFAPRLADDGAFVDCGPLAGLLAGLDAALTDEVLCVPGDAPLLPLDLVARLSKSRLGPPAAIVAFADDGHGPQPLCCLLPRSLRDDLRSYLGAGGRTPRDWFRRHHAAVANFSDAPPWAWSINTDEEWIAAERQFAERKNP